MVPSYSLVIWLPKTPKSHRSPVAPSSRKLWFSEDIQFWPKYSNGPGVAKSWQISKVTIRCHKRCLKLSWVQIWQKNSNGKCPKLPIRSAHSLRYIGGLSVNLNHLKKAQSIGNDDSWNETVRHFYWIFQAASRIAYQGPILSLVRLPTCILKFTLTSFEGKLYLCRSVGRRTGDKERKRKRLGQWWMYRRER